MFTSHFHMNSTPFQEQPPTERLFRDETVDRHLARLRYFLNQGRIALLTGHTGVGKSSLLRLFRHQLDGARMLHIIIPTPRLGATALLRAIVESMGERPARGRERLFAQIDAKARASGQTVLLEIDDAHLLDPSGILDLRLLADRSGDSCLPCFRLLLAGQDELTGLLRQDRFSDFRDRVCVRVCLYPFRDVEHTALYIERQLKSVGCAAKIFNPETISRIHAHSGGIPRRINNVATACLLAASTIGAKLIDEACCLSAIQELL